MPGPIDTDMLAASSHTLRRHVHAPYRALAELVGRPMPPSADATPVAYAAGAIVDAIVDDGSPLRVAL